MAKDPDDAKRERAEWELYLAGCPNDQLAEELAYRRGAPFLFVYIDETTKDREVMTYAYGDLNDVGTMHAGMGEYLWENFYGPKATQEADEE